MEPRVKVVLGKDTMANKKYLEVPDARIAQVEKQNMPLRDRLVEQKVAIEAEIAKVDAKLEKKEKVK